MDQFIKSRGLKKVIACCLAAFLLAGSMGQIKPVTVQAATVEEEQEKVSGLEEEKENLEAEREELGETISEEESKQEEYLQQMSEARKQIEEYQGQIDTVNVEIDDLNEKIEDLSAQIDEANKQIKQKQKEIKQKEAEIEEANETFKARLSAMYMTSSDMTVMSVLLGAESFSDFLTQSQVLQNISDNDNKLMDELADYKAELEGLKKELEDFKVELEDHKKEVETNKKEVEEKKQEIVTLQNQEEQKESEMNELQIQSAKIIEEKEAAQEANSEEAARIQKEIEEAEANIAYLIEKAEEERRQQEAASTEDGEDGEDGDGGGDGGTPSLPNSSGWINPCPGYSYISSYFGPREQPLPGASTNHGALDLAAGSGTSILAARSGTVVEANWGWGGGYGNYLILNHGDGFYTLYAHCSSLSVSSGDTVAQGQVIAKVGSTGNSTGPHLHFEVRQGGTKVNPLNYIPER